RRARGSRSEDHSPSVYSWRRNPCASATERRLTELRPSSIPLGSSPLCCSRVRLGVLLEVLPALHRAAVGAAALVVQCGFFLAGLQLHPTHWILVPIGPLPTDRRSRPGWDRRP